MWTFCTYIWSSFAIQYDRSFLNFKNFPKKMHVLMDSTLGFNQHLIIGCNWAVPTHVTIVLKLFDLDSDIADS